MSYAIAVDIGGTFTDLVAFDHATQKVLYSKSPTTYDNLVDGILDCFKKAKIKPAEASLVNHGTTLVINSLIQRQGAKTALVTSKGFRDILEIARGNRPEPFDLHYQRDEPLIPRELRFEVPERMGSKGEVVEPLDAVGVEKTRRRNKKARRGVGGDLFHELVYQYRSRRSRRRITQRTFARYLRDFQHRSDA